MKLVSLRSVLKDCGLNIYIINLKKYLINMKSKELIVALYGNGFGLHDEVFQNTGKVKKLTCVSIFALLSSSSEVSTGATLTLTFTSWSSQGGSECLLGDGVVASLPDNQNARSSWKMEHSQSLVRYLFV